MTSEPTPHDGWWRDYIRRFHSERAGVTEDVCSHLEGGVAVIDAWIREAVPAPGDVLEVACGSAPSARAWPRRWVGVDRSAAELELARGKGIRALVLGDATALPIDGARFDAVVCSLALMLLQPLDRALAELARVLRPEGRLVVVTPDTGPLTLRDRMRYARLLGALRCRRLEYPNQLDQLGEELRTAGFELLGDERRRFPCAIDDAETAQLFVESLYLPEIDARRIARAIAVTRGWVGSTIGLPLRRRVARVRR